LQLPRRPGHGIYRSIRGAAAVPSKYGLMRRKKTDANFERWDYIIWPSGAALAGVVSAVRTPSAARRNILRRVKRARSWCWDRRGHVGTVACGHSVFPVILYAYLGRRGCGLSFSRWSRPPKVQHDLRTPPHSTTLRRSKRLTLGFGSTHRYCAPERASQFALGSQPLLGLGPARKSEGRQSRRGLRLRGHPTTSDYRHQLVP
jgi:hypothetical protein